MPQRPTQPELEAYLDEDLATEEMVQIENTLRDDPKLLETLTILNGRRDAGIQSIGEIWRRARISCPNREQLGSYLLGALPKNHRKYVKFHVEQIGCRICLANLADLQRQQDEVSEVSAGRRRKYFRSSSSYLRK
jgi:hypothetical protein